MLSAAEQYLLELINRARLDPLKEAALNKIDLNQGLSPGQLGTQVRQPLAPDVRLETAAIGHSKWMLQADIFSHTGAGDSTPAMRMMAAGYSGTTVGENISWRGSTGKINTDKLIGEQHSDLVVSPSHRINVMYEGYNQIGLAQEMGAFNDGKRNFNSSMVGENFGKSAAGSFLTGVAYADKNKDNFYSIGEGSKGYSITLDGATAMTEATGGYSLAFGRTADSLAVSGRAGKVEFTAMLDADGQNVKLDVVSDKTFFTSSDITLGTGIHNARLIGAGNLDATGNSAANSLYGNRADNLLSGMAGNDSLWGDTGNDRLLGGDGSDNLFGDGGNDILWSGSGKDILTGGMGADTFEFHTNDDSDTIKDFKLSQGDKLKFDDALWGGVAKTAAQVVAEFATARGGKVMFDFDDGTFVTMPGVKSLAGLSAVVEII